MAIRLDKSLAYYELTAVKCFITLVTVLATFSLWPTRMELLTGLPSKAIALPPNIILGWKQPQPHTHTHTHTLAF
jgi:hypothetical protein